MFGPITGSVCRFTTNVQTEDKDTLGPIGSLIGGDESVHGYLVFSPDGQSARYAELKEGKLSGFSLLERVSAKTT